MNTNNPFDNVQIGIGSQNNNNNNISQNPFTGNSQFAGNSQFGTQSMYPNQHYQQYQNFQQHSVSQNNNSNYPENNNNYYSNQYDAEKDKILYEIQDQVFTGKNNQNQFTMRIRSYNNTQPKIELIRVSATNKFTKNIRLSIQEWQFIMQYSNQINQALQQLIQQSQQKPY